MSANLAYQRMDIQQKLDRFTSNTIKRMIEASLQQRAENFRPSMRRAICLSGPAIRDHQFLLSRYSEVIFPEIDREAYLLMLQSVHKQNGSKITSLSCTTCSKYRKRKYSDEQVRPKKSVLRFADFFDVYDEMQDFGLVDLDGISATSQDLLDKILHIINTNRVSGTWAFRLTFSMRNGKINPGAFLSHIDRYTKSQKCSILDFYRRSYRETNIKSIGGPMLTAQWILRKYT